MSERAELLHRKTAEAVAEMPRLAHSFDASLGRDSIAELEAEKVSRENRIAELELNLDLLLEAHGKLGKQLQDFGDEINKRGKWKVALDAANQKIADLEAKLETARNGIRDVAACARLGLFHLSIPQPQREWLKREIDIGERIALAQMNAEKP